MQQSSPVPEKADVVVIGGGINGISTFRELALQGVDVVLLERDDFCSGASAALSRMVHGGLRYLENGEFHLVQQSLEERDRLLKNAPHCVSPLPTLVPVATRFHGTLPALTSFLGFKAGRERRSGAVIRVGLTLYDFLSRKSRTMPRHRWISRRELRRMAPGMTDEAIAGILYYDAKVSHPERIGLEMVLDTEADAFNARAFSYTEVTGGDGEALRWRDRLTGEQGRIAPRLVVNATGAWVDRVENAIRPAANRRRVQGTKGSHLMVRNPALKKALDGHMVYYEHKDGRICIAFNHAGASMVGSTDIRIDDPDEAVCVEDEKRYMLGALAGVFPNLAIADDEIVHVFTGVRPLPATEDEATGRISRDHQVNVEPAGPLPFPVLTLIGGKWTTFRAFGEEVADAALVELGLERTVDTSELAIGGGRGFPTDAAQQARWIREQAEAVGLPEDRFAQLAERYGSRAVKVARFIGEAEDALLTSAPDFSRREMLFLIANERVRRIDDLLLRRTMLGIEGRTTPELVAEAAGLMAEALGWSETGKAEAVENFETIMARKHRVHATV